MRKLNYPKDKNEIEAILATRNLDEQKKELDIVTKIISSVKEKGDKALFSYTEKLDQVKLDDLKVSQTEIDQAYEKVDEDFIAAIKKSITNVADYHRKQLKESWFSHKQGNILGQIINPLARIGAYVPGGRAAYPSSVIMTIVPAKVAGVQETVMVSPPANTGAINPYTLVAAAETKVDEIYKVGGAQAIAALAFGTETIQQVDKIVGPGNIYVTLAKKLVYGQVDIDMLAGPSEVLILADKTANPKFLAADLLSQAEHDPLAVSILITDSQIMADKTEKELKEQLPRLERKAIATKSIAKQGLIIVVDKLESGIDLVNLFAPEHFELVVKEPFAYLGEIKNAGAIFIGEYAAEPLGDYLAGPNHVLPTAGTARFASPLNIDDYLKKSSIIYYQKKGLKKVAKDIVKLASLEGLDAHAASIKVRFSENERWWNNDKAKQENS